MRGKLSHSRLCCIECTPGRKKFLNRDFNADSPGRNFLRRLPREEGIACKSNDIDTSHSPTEASAVAVRKSTPVVNRESYPSVDPLPAFAGMSTAEVYSKQLQKLKGFNTTAT